MAIRKQPNVIISGRDDWFEMIRCSQAASTARGIGDASDLSKGILV